MGRVMESIKKQINLEKLVKIEATKTKIQESRSLVLGDRYTITTDSTQNIFQSQKNK